MDTHIQTHDKEAARQFTCEVCGKRFTCKNDQQCHYKTIYGPPPTTPSPSSITVALNVPNVPSNEGNLGKAKDSLQPKPGVVKQAYPWRREIYWCLSSDAVWSQEPCFFCSAPHEASTTTPLIPSIRASPTNNPQHHMSN